MKKKPKWNENAVIRGALRRGFVKSPAIIAVKQRARKEFPKYKKDKTLAKKPAVKYKCAACGNWFKGTDVAVDHISPVILNGFEDWNVFIERLFCGEDNLQVLCNYKLKDIDKYNNIPSCHLKKTRSERLKLKNK